MLYLDGAWLHMNLPGLIRRFLPALAAIRGFTFFPGVSFVYAILFRVGSDEVCDRLPVTNKSPPCVSTVEINQVLRT